MGEGQQKGPAGVAGEHMDGWYGSSPRATADGPGASLERVSRPSWDAYFLELAAVVAKRGTCSRASVGCVIVDGRKRVISTGYNGALPGARHCSHHVIEDYSDDEDGNGVYERVHDMENGHCSNALHAEANAVCNAVASLVGATAYVTVTPCLKCYQLLRAAGVTSIVYAGEYRPHPIVEASVYTRKYEP